MMRGETLRMRCVVALCLLIQLTSASLLQGTARGAAVSGMLKAGMDFEEFKKSVEESGMSMEVFRKKALQKCVDEKLISGLEHLETPDDSGWRPVQLAVKAERADHVPPHVALLAAAGADLNSQTNSGVTGLLVAAFAGNAQMARALLLAGADADFQEAKEGRTALLMAAAGGSAKVVAALLERGAAVDKPDIEGRTALWAAARFGNKAVVEALLASGADPLAGEEKAVECVCNSLKEGDERLQDKEAIQALLERAADERSQHKHKAADAGKAEEAKQEACQ